MTDGVSSSAAAGPSAHYQNATQRQTLDDNSAFLNLLDQGLGQLTQRPDLASQSDRMTGDLSGQYSGDVGDAKLDLVGGEAARVDQSSEAANLSLEDRVKSLYSELTHYQIAWKIAQNVQRDISQVLRGS